MVPASDWPDILPNWSVVFSDQSTEDTIPDMEFGTKQYAFFVSVTVCNIIRIYSKVEDYKIENKTRVNTEYEWEKMAAASTSSRY